MTPPSSAPVDAVLSAHVECAATDGAGAAWEIGAAVFCPACPAAASPDMPDPAHLRGAQDAAKRDQHAQAFELLEGQIMYVMKLDAADARALLAERLPVQEPVGG